MALRVFSSASPMQHTVDSGFGAGHDVGHHSEGLGELADALLAVVLDQVAGPRALLVAHGALGLVLDLVELVLEDADAGFVHREARKGFGRLGFGKLVPDRLADQVPPSPGARSGTPRTPLGRVDRGRGCRRSRRWRWSLSVACSCFPRVVRPDEFGGGCGSKLLPEGSDAGLLARVVNLLDDGGAASTQLLPLLECRQPLVGRADPGGLGVLVPVRKRGHRTILRSVVELLRGEMLAEPGVTLALDLLDVVRAGPERAGSPR